MYDPTDRDSFDNIALWSQQIDEVRFHGWQVAGQLCGWLKAAAAPGSLSILQYADTDVRRYLVATKADCQPRWQVRRRDDILRRVVANALAVAGFAVCFVCARLLSC